MTITNPAQPPHVCAQCGTVLATSGGRCPQCGAVQPDAPATPRSFQPAPFVPSRPAPVANADRRVPMVALIVAISGVVVAGIVAVIVMDDRRRTAEDTVASSATAPNSSRPFAPVDPNDMGVKDLSAVSITEIVPRAMTRARAWQKDALLVAIQASPVKNGVVDAKAGGRVEIVFAKPGGARLGPGAPAGTAQLAIAVSADGSKVADVTSEPGSRAVEEPICVAEEAWRKMVASGVPSNADASMRFGYSDKHEKAVWTTTVESDPKATRTIDGRTCSIILR